MTKKQFDIYETESMLAGGQSAGQFLDTIGVTDLAELNETQFVHFFAKFLGGYEDAMKKTFQSMIEASLCSVCNEPQFETPHGTTCKNGHGGAESV